MKRMVLVFLFIVTCLLLDAGLLPVVRAQTIDVYFLYLETCVNCHDADIALSKLIHEYPNIHIIAIDIFDSSNMEVLSRLSRDYELGNILAPTIILNDRIWVGFNSDVETQIRQCLDHTSTDYNIPDYQLSTSKFGNVDYERSSIFFLTLLIAFIDGFNPCSLWVLTLLLSLALNYRSRQKLVLVGITFLIVTALIYGLFMTSVFQIMTFLEYYSYIRVLMNLFVLAFGFFNVRSYFAEENLIAIPQKGREFIHQSILKLIKIRNSLLIVGAATIVAGSAAIVELPCTAGFPVLWSSIISQREVTGPFYYLLLILYLVVYLLDEVMVFGILVFSQRIKRISQVTGKRLKLLSGLVMIYLGLISYTSNSNISIRCSLLIFVLSFVSFFAILGLEKFYLNRNVGG